MENLKDILDNDLIEAMKQTPQSPKFHGEGDVYTHTMMVCEALKSLPEFNELKEVQQNILYSSPPLAYEAGEVIWIGH